MGLDIAAYNDLTLTNPHPHTETCYDQAHIYIHPGEAIFKHTHYDLQPERCYEPTDDTDRYGFRAGSYSGYNGWRDQLSQTMLGITAKEVWRGAELLQEDSALTCIDAPFAELISFSDCEGFIGPGCSAKLVLDFIEHQAKANQESEEFQHVYNSFREAFRRGAQKGLVAFQ